MFFPRQNKSEGTHFCQLQPSLRRGAQRESFLDPIVGPVDRRDDLTPPLVRDVSAPLFQLVFWDRAEKVTLAERRPVQAVRLVKDHFSRLWIARGAFGGAHHDVTTSLWATRAGCDTITHG
jgi:hypothetical protein